MKKMCSGEMNFYILIFIHQSGSKNKQMQYIKEKNNENLTIKA